uniref:TadE/TadG family type IV pilus assembly protein n=1 Tax=uncultured Caulobacter sp. TaxID=158749 RepID=UPI0025D6E4DA|nr:TadE/TadG family type IV pilus assembly protein [uncultured Caulobacter sp.]
MSARKPSGPKRYLKRFWRSRRGATAVEFALIAPILITLYCGMAEMTQAMMAQRRLSNIASAIGDLVAQSSQTGPLKTNDIFKIGNTIMAPFPTTGALKMCLVSITSNSTGKDTVAWSKPSVSNMTNCPAPGAVLTDVSTGVLPANQSVIMARVSYTYTPAIKMFLPSGLTFNRTYYLRPRKTDTVLWNTAS